MAEGAVSLRRALGQRDLVFLFVVAVVNINNVPVIAASGAVTVWMWVLALMLFFLPQGVAVIELSDRYPHEGGVYLWTKEIFGRLSWLHVRVVLLDQQHVLHPDSGPLRGWHLRVHGRARHGTR